MVYSNFFTSYVEATRSIGEHCNSEAYSHQRWITRLEGFNKDILNNHKPFYAKKLPRSSCLPLFLSGNDNLKTILDLGGGGGWLGLYIKRHYQRIELYDLIEIKYVENYFRAYLSDHNIGYIGHDNQNHYDIIYSNSCIQYFPNIDLLMKCVLNTSPKYVVLDDVYLSRKEQFFCHQKYYENTMVMNFMNYNYLEESMSKANYRLCFSSIYRDPILGEDQKIPFDDSVPEDWRPHERYTFIYRKNQFF